MKSTVWGLGIGDWGFAIALRAAASGIWGLGIGDWVMINDK